MIDRSASERRVQTLLSGARRLADPHDELGQVAWRELPGSTGLSPENVEAALGLCLETRVEAEVFARLCQSIAPSPRAHVLLPANVFIAPLRAIFLALIASSNVSVRPSRREPLFVELLARAAPGLFEIVSTLEPRAGDQIWAYGSDTTLAELEATLAPGVTLHAHGSGMGIVIVDERQFGACSEQELEVFCDGVALDVALFDQRGCLSPRLVVMHAGNAFVERLRIQLHKSCEQIAARIPSGLFSASERSDATWYRETLAAVGSWWPLKQGGIGVLQDDLELLPPVGRHLQICVVGDLTSAIAEIAPLVTTVACPSDSPFYRPVLALLPGARVSAAGKMQQPALDGPVDQRRSGSGAASSRAAGA